MSQNWYVVIHLEKRERISWPQIIRNVENITFHTVFSKDPNTQKPNITMESPFLVWVFWG